MNHPNRNTLKAVLAATVLLGISATAHAEESLSHRVATGVGQVIAAQGNAALIQIREELQERLIYTMSPLLPPHPELAGQPAPATPDRAGAQVAM
jgi:hypothetical protein